MGKLKTYQEQLQEIVEKGINAAEEQQKKLASKPFDYAEKVENGVREYSVSNVRTRYYSYSESLFEQLRSLNTKFGSFAADLVAKLEKEVAEGADEVTSAAQSAKSEVAGDTAAKKPAAKKPAAKKATADSASA